MPADEFFDYVDCSVHCTLYIVQRTKKLVDKCESERLSFRLRNSNLKKASRKSMKWNDIFLVAGGCGRSFLIASIALYIVNTHEMYIALCSMSM